MFRSLFRGMSSNMSTTAQLLRFLWQRKLWWLIPMILVLMVFGILLAFAASTGVGPFIYALF